MPIAQYADGSGGSTALPANTCTRQQLIDWGANLRAVAATGLGQLEGLGTVGLVVAKDITPDAEVFSTAKADVWSAFENSETLTAAGAVSVATRVTCLNAAAGAHAMTLANGTFAGQEKFLQFSGGSGSTATFVFSGMVNLKGGAGFTLDAANYSMALKWDAVAGMWAQMGGNCVVT